MKGLNESYDMIFMDAAKGQYIHFLPDALRLLRTGGVLVSDNVLQDGDIIESHYAVERRNRTIYKRMREYLYVLKHTDGLLTSIVPVGDGAAVTVKQKVPSACETEKYICIISKAGIFMMMSMKYHILTV